MKMLPATLFAMVLAAGAPALGVSGSGSAPEAAPMPLSELLPSVKKPALWIGDDAPAMTIASYLKGDSIDAFEEDHTYVVEFWATWCGPCIRAFPHLSDLQAQYSDEITVIGVNIWEQEQGAARAELVERFVENQGERMGYTVALEEGGSMAEGWMRPAGQNGIPAAFVVDGGKVAWIGHPINLDPVLEEISSGAFDIDQAAEEAWNERLTREAFRTLQAALGEKDWGMSLELGRSLAAAGGDNPMLLNAVSWGMLSHEGAPEKNLAFALRAAERACELTGWESWIILDTYAKALDMTGDSERAAEMQRKAVEFALQDEGVGEDILEELRAALASYGG